MTLGPLDMCRWIEGLPLAEGVSWHCAGDGPVAGLAGLVALVVAVAVFVRAARGRGLPAVVAAVLLAVAAGRPEVRVEAPGAPGRLIAVVDHSDSLVRAAAGFAKAEDALAARIAELATQHDPARRGSFVVFGALPEIPVANAPLTALSEFVRRPIIVPPDRMASDAGAAVDTALGLASDDVRAPEIALLSDGNWPDGAAERIVAAARGAGARIHVLPFGSDVPAAGLIAADIAPVQTEGAPAIVRLVVRGPGTLTALAEEVAVPAGETRAMRLETVFAGRGLQAVDLALASGGVTERRRLYTMVEGPARVLVLGDPAWVDSLPAERFATTLGDPGTPPDPRGYDVIVVDGLRPGDLPQTYDDQLLEAAEAGRGLFLVNGPMLGSPEAVTAMMAWEASALDPVLPIDSDARTVIEQPPPRDVVLILDASGSMGSGDGWRLEAAKRLAVAIVDSLRPVDTVRVVAFADRMADLTGQVLADAAGLAQARDAITRLAASGGTDPTGVFDFAQRIGGNYCGIFFLSDGDFATAPTQPGCTTTVLEIKEQGGVSNPGLARFGEVRLIRPGDERRPLKLRFFEPEPRDQRFRPGTFVPEGVTPDPVLAPPLSVDGLAISYPRADAVRVLVHPEQPPDPLVAFRTTRGPAPVATGVFMGAIPEGWHDAPEGQAALAAYLDRLSGWSGGKRYLVRLEEEGEDLSLTVTVLADAPPATLVAQLSGPDGDRPIFLTATPEPGRFVGRIRRPEGGGAAELRLSEPGLPTQRLPVHLPADPIRTRPAGGPETWDAGIDREVLEHVARATGGVMLDRQTLPIPAPPPQGPGQPLHLPLIAGALVLVASGLWLGGGRA